MFIIIPREEGLPHVVASSLSEAVARLTAHARRHGRGVPIAPPGEGRLQKFAAVCYGIHHQKVIVITPSSPPVLAELYSMGRLVENLTAELEKASDQRDQLIQQAVSEGVGKSTTAVVAGVHRNRVNRLTLENMQLKGY